jgi:hypothetical protein
MTKLGLNLIYNLEIGNNIEREREEYYNIYIYIPSILVCSNCIFNMSTKFTTKFEFKVWNLKMKRKRIRKEKGIYPRMGLGPGFGPNRHPPARPNM